MLLTSLLSGGCFDYAAECTSHILSYLAGKARSSSAAARIQRGRGTHKARMERKKGSGSRLGAIHLAARGGHVEVLRLLLVKGADVDSLSGEGATTLHLAVRLGERECVRLLVANEAKLHVAARMGDEAMVELLLKKGGEQEGEELRGEDDIRSGEGEGGGEGLGRATVRGWAVSGGE
ncbi:hypothetical protein Fmac_005242 [Flemingia macrophylla]|uniref:Ankyrin repeat protein n=1 Tax=Flemingia macrophylla TaxID=520843 RepID=A0ABD1N784_9FABA